MINIDKSKLPVRLSPKSGSVPPPYNPKTSVAEGESNHPMPPNVPNTPSGQPVGKKNKGKRPVLVVAVIVGLLFIGGIIGVIIWWVNRDFTVSPQSLTFESEGGEARLKVEGPGDWEVRSTPKSWVYLVADGEYLVCAVSENNDFERGDTIVIGNDRNSCRVILRQESGAFVATPSVQDVQARPGTYRYLISGQEDWRIDQGPDGWGTVFREDNYLVWTVEENHGSRRSDYVVLRSGNKTISVGINQEAALRASSNHITGGSSEHTSYVTISGTHDWSCRSSEYWLDVEREDNRIRLEFSKNDSGDQREGYIIVTGGGQELRIPVTQNKASSGGGYYPYYWGW